MSGEAAKPVGCGGRAATDETKSQARMRPERRNRRKAIRRARPLSWSRVSARCIGRLQIGIGNWDWQHFHIGNIHLALRATTKALHGGNRVPRFVRVETPPGLEASASARGASPRPAFRLAAMSGHEKPLRVTRKARKGLLSPKTFRPHRSLRMQGRSRPVSWSREAHAHIREYMHNAQSHAIRGFLHKSLGAPAPTGARRRLATTQAYVR